MSGALHRKSIRQLTNGYLAAGVFPVVARWNSHRATGTGKPARYAGINISVGNVGITGIDTIIKNGSDTSFRTESVKTEAIMVQ
jgi:hypothetical protein